MRFATTAVTVLFLAGCGEVAPPAKVEPPPAEREVPAEFKVSEQEWERGKQEELARPPKVWVSAETDPFDQGVSFDRWASETGFIVPEVESAVRDWLRTDSREFEQVITNEPTGAQYRVIASKDNSGVTCSIKFIGNLNWK
jgi:hypothetical protein